MSKQVTYHNPDGTTRELVIIKEHGKGLVDLAEKEGGEAVITECPLVNDAEPGVCTPADGKKVKEPAEGFARSPQVELEDDEPNAPIEPAKKVK